MRGVDPVVAAVLGAVQGVTEFLPVSSSGHVAMVASMLGVDDLPLAMVVVVHAGTLLATLVVVGPDLLALSAGTLRGLARPKELLATEQGQIAAGVVVATLPTAVIGFALEHRVSDWSHVPWIVGTCFLVTAGVVLVTRVAERGHAEVLSLGRCFLIGLAQGVAVLPGVSRSGATIATAMLLGMAPAAAFRFSFLLSVPVILGAVVLELPHLVGASLAVPALIAGSVAFVTGYVALRILRSIVMQGRFWVFAIYLVPLGVGLIAWDLFG